MATKINPPDEFDFRKPEEWEKWIRRFNRFRIASELHKKSEDIQVNSLIYAMGPSADDVLTTFVFDEGENTKFDIVKGKFDAYFNVRRNVIYERAKFNQRKQDVDESAEEFITSLYCLAENCAYGNLKEEMIRDRIVVGVKDAKLSEKMQLETTLTLETAVRMVRECESIKKQQAVVRTDNAANVNVDVLRAFQKFSNKKPVSKSQVNHANSQQSADCQRCGRPAHANRKDCKALNAICHKCSRKGHFAKVCKALSSVNEVTADSDESCDSLFLGEVQGEMKSTQWNADVRVNGHKVNFKMDSGADVSAIPEAIFCQIGQPEVLVPSDRKLYGPCRTLLNCKGKVRVMLAHEDNSYEEEIYVIANLEKSLLGRNACQQLKMIARLDLVEGKTLQDYAALYPKLFDGLGCIEGEYEIKVDETVKPFNLTAPRRIPIPRLPKVEEEIARMENLGVIERVEQPTQWCSPIVVVPKKNGTVRICGDFVKLNEAVQREVYQMPTTEESLAKLAGAKIVTKLDANSGFWQRKLSDSSKLLTTFITPWGRYCFTRLPFGISSAPEHFQKVMSRVLEGLPGQVCQVDDILVFGENQEQHDQRLKDVLDRLQEKNVTLNAEKCRFSQEKVQFLGHIVGKDGVEVDPAKVEAISEMEAPTDVPQLRRFLGVVNQVGKYIENLADLTMPLRGLLNKNSAWLWGEAQQQAFDNIKQALAKAPALAIYDSSKETKVSSDASSFGLGAVLLQSDTEGSWKPIAYISRAMTETEQRYAQVEKEALAVTWACERLSDYLIGKTFHIETDHKPLVSLLGYKNLNELPPRIQRLRMRLLRFKYTISHVPGKSIVIADTLSRAPVTKVKSGRDENQSEEIELYVDSVLSEIPASDKRLEEIRERQKEDEVCKQIASYCKDGWPARGSCPEALKAYWPERNEITLVKGILLKGCRIIIPPVMRLDILDRLHEGHQGITKCRARAKASVWWPGLSQHIEDLVHRCRKCAEQRTVCTEPLISSVTPERPWQIIATDLFYLKGHTYLVVIDYFSRYVEVALLMSTQTSRDVIQALKSIFARHGVPETVRSDNGPQFISAEFLKFAKDWGFHSVTSSPRYAQANGEAERGVQTVKNLLKKEEDPAKALLSYRSTKLECGYSPAELLFGRNLRTRIPVTESELLPRWKGVAEFKEEEEVRKQVQKISYDNHHAAKELPVIPSGTSVWVRDLKVPATVTKAAETPRSYILQTPKGTVRRNRKFLNTYSPKQTDPEEVEKVDDAGTDHTPHTTTRSGRVSRPPPRLDM